MEAQLQIRQNALEAQEFAQDLLQWTQSMSQKSAGKQSSQQQTDQGVPSVRGRAPGSVQAAPTSMQQPAMQPSKVSAARADRPPAAHTYANYSKWDKFDPDAADGAPDQPAAAKQASKQVHAGSSKFELPQARQPATPQASAAKQQHSSVAGKTPAAEAAALKDRGNKLFQAGYYDDAVGCCTQSIDLQPTSLAYANRAMARLKLRQYAEAEQDCTAALQLDSSYIKALHRRGTARRQLGRLLEAAVDFEEALRLEPGNATVQADRDAALEQHLQQQKLQVSNAAWSSIPVTAPPQPPQQQSQKQDTQQQAIMEASSKPVAVLDSPTKAATAGVHTADSKVSATSATTAAVSTDSSTPAAAAAAAAVQQPPPRSPSPQQASTAAAAAAAAAALAARRAASLKPPKTGNDFEAAWRSFKGDVQLQAKYLALLSVQQLPIIFKTSLTAPLLRDILTAALTAVAGSAAATAAASAGSSAGNDAGSSVELSAGHAVGLLQQLPKLPRFDMTSMCLTSRDKSALRELWDAAAAAAACSPDIGQQLAAVKPKFRL